MNDNVYIIKLLHKKKIKLLRATKPKLCCLLIFPNRFRKEIIKIWTSWQGGI